MGAASGVWSPIFSNFHVEPDGSNVEREFQAAKHQGYVLRQALVLGASTPWMAKDRARSWRLKDDELAAWDKRKVEVMLYFIDRKADDWEYVRRALLATDDRNIVEFNKHHDNFWGDCTCMKCYRLGQNWLGEVLMLVRRRLQEGKPLYDEYTMHMLAAAQER